METSCVRGKHSSVCNTSSVGMVACLIPLRFSYAAFMCKSPERRAYCVAQTGELLAEAAHARWGQ